MSEIGQKRRFFVFVCVSFERSGSQNLFHFVAENVAKSISVALKNERKERERVVLVNNDSGVIEY
jgi:hypothetical protein